MGRDCICACGQVQCSHPIVRRQGQGQSTNIKMMVSIRGWGVALRLVSSPRTPAVPAEAYTSIQTEYVISS